jgi:hypothetical protein
VGCGPPVDARRDVATPQGASPVVPPVSPTAGVPQRRKARIGASDPVLQFTHPPAFERRCIRSCCVALLAAYFQVRLSRAPCRRGASSLSVLRRMDELKHSPPRLLPASLPLRRAPRFSYAGGTPGSEFRMGVGCAPKYGRPVRCRRFNGHKFSYPSLTIASDMENA